MAFRYCKMKTFTALIPLLSVLSVSSEWPVPYPEYLVGFESMRHLTSSMTQYGTVCASPETFAGDSFVEFEEFDSPEYPKQNFFTGPCAEVLRTNRCFVGWDWETVTCQSFKTDEHKYLISQLGKCCSDGRSVCDVITVV